MAVVVARSLDWGVALLTRPQTKQGLMQVRLPERTIRVRIQVVHYFGSLRVGGLSSKDFWDQLKILTFDCHVGVLQKKNAVLNAGDQLFFLRLVPLVSFVLDILRSNSNVVLLWEPVTHAAGQLDPLELLLCHVAVNIVQVNINGWLGVWTSLALTKWHPILTFSGWIFG